MLKRNIKAQERSLSPAACAKQKPDETVCIAMTRRQPRERVSGNATWGASLQLREVRENEGRDFR